MKFEMAEHRPGSRILSVDGFVAFDARDIEQSICSRFEQVVGRHPGRLAVRTHSAQVTYDELNREANRIANAMLTLRTGSRAPVVLLAEPGVSSVASIIATLKAGACFVQLEPTNPRARNADIFRDSEPDLVVTDARNQHLARELTNGAIPVLNVDEVGDGGSHANPRAAISPDAFAYILFTSGSTGRPKGVVQNHRNVLHNVMRHTNTFRISSDDRQSMLYPGGVYGGTRDTFNALLNGASLHFFSVKQEGVGGLSRWLVRENITIYCSVATVFRQLVATLDGSEQLPELRLIKLGGEATYVRDVELFKARFADGCVLHCGLGTTETGLVRSYFVDRGTELTGATVPLGHAVEGMDLLMLDDAGRNVGPGKIAEIAIKSRYIALGYWRRPDLSDKAFVATAVDDGDRIYRTGDLGFLTPDGCLEHRGRKDRQVKIRGNRVELAEIEMVLLAIPGIKEAVVVVRQDARGDDCLVGYWVAGRDPVPNASAIRRGVAEKLPDHMVPSAFVSLGALPLLPNGKVDRARLPPVAWSRRESNLPLLAPRSATECWLAEIWCQMLRVEPIGIHDNFFEMGGHSVLAARLLSRVSERSGIEVPLQVLLRGPSIAELATVIDTLARTAGPNRKIRANPRVPISRAIEPDPK